MSNLNKCCGEYISCDSYICNSYLLYCNQHNCNKILHMHYDIEINNSAVAKCAHILPNAFTMQSDYITGHINGQILKVSFKGQLVCLHSSVLSR